MNINYKLQGVKPIKKLSVRFYHHKFDLSTVTNIMLMESEWDSVNQSVIGNSEVTIALQDLKSAILKQYNRDFCNGVLIDKVWLQKVVKTSFGRPKEEENLVSPDHTIYVSDFSTWWLDTQAVEWSVSAKKKMDVPLQNQYKKFVKTLQEYEKVIGEKLQLRSIKIKDLKSFVDYLDSENYQTSTIERQIGRFRFFLNRASEHNIEVNQSFKQRIYFDKDEDIEGVYLNEKEISKIYNLDLSHDEDLDNVRDNLIISVWTALRISDFMYNLNTENIKDGIISIKTNKTGSFVKIPVHYQVKSILFKRFGNLPKKISSSEYNIKVKKVCQLAEIDYLVYGKLFDNKLKRKAVNYYKKYELISSHVGRKSLISNLRGKVSNETLMAIGGWKSEKMINHYTKTSKTEYARLLENFWENN
jgi:integrase